MEVIVYVAEVKVRGQEKKLFFPDMRSLTRATKPMRDHRMADVELAQFMCKNLCKKIIELSIGEYEKKLKQTKEFVQNLFEEEALERELQQAMAFYVPKKSNYDSSEWDDMETWFQD